jgi:electron transport complex protein RnfE
MQTREVARMSDRNRKIADGIRNSALIQNPVLFEAIGIAPIAAIAVSLKTAIILAVASCLELVIIELFTCLALKKVKSYFRMPVYAALGMLINLPVFMFFAKFTPNEALNVGIFLPLLAVNSLIALHCERFAVKNKMKDTFVDAISAAAGYAFVLLLVGTAREILGSGTIYSVDLHLPVQLSGLLMPFGGLLLVGFLAAAVKALIAKRYPEEDPEKAFSLQEISESHVGSFRTLAQSDFNPYGDTEDEDSPRVKREKKEKPVKEKHGKKKTKQEKIKKEKPKKSGKVSKQKAKPDIVAAEMPQSVPAASPAAKTEERPVRRARQEDDDYLLEFDEMLSELDSYKKKQHEKAEEAEKAAEAAQTAAAEAAQATAAQEATVGEPAPAEEKPKRKAKSKAKAETEPKKKTTSKAKSEDAPKKKAAKSETAARKTKKKAEDESIEPAEPKKPAKKKAETTKKSTSKAKTPAKKQEGGDEK